MKSQRFAQVPGKETKPNAKWMKKSLSTAPRLTMSTVFYQTSFRSVTIHVTGELWINMQLKLSYKEKQRVPFYLETQHSKTIYSVSFRRYSRSLHARIEQWNHNFSFDDAHDPCVFHSPDITGLLEHYKDPSACMFFEPLLSTPLIRTFPFPLQHICRTVICNCTTYDGIDALPIPSSMKLYLKEYHYKSKVRVLRIDAPKQQF